MTKENGYGNVNMRECEKVLKALANQRRLQLFSFLKSHGEANVGRLMAEIGLSFGATSRHLMILYRTDFLDREQRGLDVFYRISDSPPAWTRDLLSRL